MFKFYKLLFFSTMIIGTLISISSNSWMGMWMGLEINLLSIIPLMNNNKNALSVEASLKYFITQAIASTIILFSIIMMSLSFDIKWIESSYSLIFNSALLTKMGSAPFHFWFPEVMEGLNWFNCLILLTWQKIAPMVLITYNFNMPLFFSTIIILSMLVSGIMGLNQISLRKILAFSSINHIAWMLASMFSMETTWLLYFLIYTIISINIVVIFKILNIFYISQIFLALKKNILIKIFFMMNFLSLGGLPPFLGFFPKWITIQGLIESKFYLLAFLMVILTLLTLYYYMRLIFSTLMINTLETNYHLSIKNNYFVIFLTNFISIIGLVFCTMMFNFC
uniref:NADH-ubiquinone oxidoreductase chain 2 n=1 Tax=Necrodes littoralis TaxID=414927 RepID=A0A889ZCP0_NECLI|nr:NADH dehydrogenase subunit 2 [Necrodes littoralis]QRF92663.1 NADH dehydrogenase subunit 2 [Necrodes littoralis]